MIGLLKNTEGKGKKNKQKSILKPGPKTFKLDAPEIPKGKNKAAQKNVQLSKEEPATAAVASPPVNKQKKKGKPNVLPASNGKGAEVPKIPTVAKQNKQKAPVVKTEEVATASTVSAKKRNKRKAKGASISEDVAVESPVVAKKQEQKKPPVQKEKQQTAPASSEPPKKKRRKNKHAAASVEEKKTPIVAPLESTDDSEDENSVEESPDDDVEDSSQDSDDVENTTQDSDDVENTTQDSDDVENTSQDSDDVLEKYPILKNEELIQKFLKVKLINNQKGRIRNAVKEQLKGTPDSDMPDLLNGKIQAILTKSKDPNDTELRRIRVLFNMLKVSLSKLGKIVKNEKKDKQGKQKKAAASGNKNEKVKGPKRYVVFIGNLPLDIDNEKIKEHFCEISKFIKNIRMQELKEGSKARIAFMELSSESSYQVALSKHHTMLDNKRINVLYSKQENGKVTAAEAKSKTAKLIALQKSGQLIGSVPLAKKRSQRRLKKKLAEAKQKAD